VGKIAKEDIPPLPAHPPKKRKAMEQVLDIHLAIWANGTGLTPSEYRRVNEERERRKQFRVVNERIGVVLGREGTTPEQQEKLRELLSGRRIASVLHPWVPGPVHHICAQGSKGATVIVVGDPKTDVRDAWKTVVKNATLVIAFPRGEDGELWDTIRYTRHRNIPIIVIMPSGERR
jgi:hypothetical protein